MKICEVEECSKLYYAKGRCSMHYHQVKTRICELDGCDRKHNAHGLCSMHERRLKLHGSTGTPPSILAQITNCTVDGCNKKHFAFGKCRSHYSVWYRYGITHEQFIEMLEKQNYLCKICLNKLDTEKRNAVHIDHCHETGVVRGVLCDHCNLGIGKLKDSIETLERAIQYIKNQGDI